jgi:purine-binding chemotaxis protein CheW
MANALNSGRQTPRETRQYSTFRVGDLFLGIEVVKVQEVIRFQEMTDVPLAPAVIEGLINLRGQIVTAVDTRRSLGLGAAPHGALPMNIVIRSEDGVVSLLVDEIGDVLDVPVDSYAPTPDNMPAEQQELIEGVYRVGSRLMLVLNTQSVLHKACN